MAIPNSLTDVTTMTTIPPMSDCQTMLESLNAGNHNAISCSLGFFEKSSLKTLLKIDGLIAIKRKVTEEKIWLKLNLPAPSENCTPPDQLLIAAYEKLLFENTNDRVVIGKEIIASDLSSLTSNSWLTLSIMKRFAELLRGPLSKIHPSVFGRKNKFSSYFVYELDFGQY